MQREYCAEVAQAEDEPMAGTADVVDVWIMLEYLPAWTAKATSRQRARRADESVAEADCPTTCRRAD